MPGIQVVGSIQGSDGPATYLLYRFGHEISSKAILSLPLIQVGHLSVTGESIGT